MLTSSYATHRHWIEGTGQIVCAKMKSEESFIEDCRRRVVDQYTGQTLGSGETNGCFGSILCHEIHHGGPECTGLSFIHLAEKWGIPVSVLGEVIYDHCKRLEPLLQVDHSYSP